MYLSGYSPANPVQFPASKSIGNVVMRIDDWGKGNRTPRWRRVISYEDASNGSGGLHHQPNSLAVAGDYLFIAWANRPHGDTRVLDAATGAVVGTILPDPVVQENIGLIDIAYGIRAFKQAGGDYLLSMEEGAKGKVLLFRRTPPPPSS